ncbi:MAG: hypothetical protein ACFFBD_08715, partial [Candidatus Hodarchaeota archaeon]
LKLLTILKASPDLLLPGINWLMDQRKTDIGWGSTADTVSVIEFLSLVTTGVLSDQKIVISMDNEILKEVKIDEETSLDVLISLRSIKLPYNAIEAASKDKILRISTEGKGSTHFALTTKQWYPKEHPMNQKFGQGTIRFSRAYEKTELEMGDNIEVELIIDTESPQQMVIIEDYIPPGFILDAEYLDSQLRNIEHFTEKGCNLYVYLPRLEKRRKIKYRLATTKPGVFSTRMACVYPMYIPEDISYCEPTDLTIGGGA